MKTTYAGNIDGLDTKKIVGWFCKKDEDEPLNVDIFINKQKIGSCVANIYRKRIAESNVHKTGNVGFLYHFKKNDLKIGDKVEIGINNTIVNVHNSPKHFRANRVLIIGLAKSGTSALFYKIAQNMQSPKMHFEPGTLKSLQMLDLHKEITKSIDVVTKSIFYPNMQGTQLSEIEKLYSKKILLVRDPRDVLISSFFYKWNKSHNQKLEDFNKALTFIKQKEKNQSFAPFFRLNKGIGNIHKNYESLIQLWKSLGKNWFVLKFEDMVDGNVKKLNEYLGFDIALDANVAKKLARVERSKTYGSWRNWFTIDDIYLYKEFLNKYLRLLNYDHNDWKLNEEPVLKPEEGSLYMEKLFY